MKKLFYIDYPQEHIEGQLHRYRCLHCKEETTVVNGRLDGHLPNCKYRTKLENVGYDVDNNQPTTKLAIHDADDFD